MTHADIPDTMSTTIKQYVEAVDKRYKQNNGTEHTFRSDLQQLLETLDPSSVATNEPRRQKCGAPDFVVTRQNIPIGYIETKDIGKKLTSKTYKEQFGRYLAALDNLIVTDYLKFEYYVDGKLVTTVAIAEIRNGKLVPLPDNYDLFGQIMSDFFNHKGHTISNSKTLAQMMAAKARLLANVLEKTLIEDERPENSETSTLQSQFEGFKEILIHTITPREFADLYAQTIAYGMFAARLHDATLDTFTRFEAARFIPRSNPFLRKLFQFIAGNDLDTRISWIVDALADVFRHTDVKKFMQNFGTQTRQNDPMIHFYETFLTEYDPGEKVKRGVWYTPEPVVNFIVRSVDDILQTEFDIADGLADRSKVQKQVTDKDGTETTREFHKIQILDPATGTGTFLAEVVKNIYNRYSAQQGMWNGYAEEHLIPRINGFELLMASYAMAHLKLEMLFDETGFRPSANQRFNVYLTNSLEESHADTNNFFAALSHEANAANRIKRDVPVMCVMGNPPYSGESANKGKWIMDLMQDYKKEPGGKVKLKERNPKWINNDFVKFIRLGQHFIKTNGDGILAYINPDSYLDSPTLRGMRWNLLTTFDKIYVIDLHGDIESKEIATDGSKDKNVFDITEGVAINFFIKTGNKPDGELAEVYHCDIIGKREYKYEELLNNSLRDFAFSKVNYSAPSYFFKPQNEEGKEEYEKGFSIPDLFKVNGVGICSKRDKIAYQNNKEQIKLVMDDFLNLSETDIKIKYKVTSESRDQKISLAKENIKQYGVSEQYIKQINYRPFDQKWTYYTKKVRGFLAYPVYNIMRHFLEGENYGLVVPRQCVGDWRYAFISKNICDINLIGTAGKYGSGIVAPLYLYPDANATDMFAAKERIPNLDEKIVAQIADRIGLEFVSEPDGAANTFAPVDLLDYIYAVLHSPHYRTTYKEFLKTDFPRVPYPQSSAHFRRMAGLGSKLRKLHLMTEVPDFRKYTFPQAGSCEVLRVSYEAESETSGKVYINDTQYFEHVPLAAWNFYIGGYQPAQKWLKDRKDKVLSLDDMEHYQKIISALAHTDALMTEIDQ